MNEIIKKNGITFGIILGLFSVLITTAIYAIDLNLFTSWWIGGVAIVIPIIIGVVLVSKTKKQLNGILVFKDAFTVYFIAALIGSFIAKIYEYVLFNFIDPQAKETIKEITIKYTTEVMEKFGAPASAVNEAMQKAAETDNYSLSNIFFGFTLGLVFHAIFGLILAAIFKSKSNEGL
ncbi:DUF4199 domain-containing protein [Flavobacterium sp. RSB2_4_14]|uniref:DUF4199 domain-containing protein n=1 Tax=Flavobacterium sp. RSB2_4_14 TaxID=3447665 RepID=UPI003F36A97B